MAACAIAGKSQGGLWLRVGLSDEPGLHKQVLEQAHHVADHQRVTVHRPAIWQLDRPAQKQQHQHKDRCSMGSTQATILDSHLHAEQHTARACLCLEDSSRRRSPKS